MTDPDLAVLNSRIEQLTQTVAVRDGTIKKLRATTRIALIGTVVASVVAVASIAVGIWVWQVAKDADDAAERAAEAVAAAQVAAQDTKNAQMVNCQNSNSTREGQRILWDFIIDLSGADAGPAEAAALAEIRTWIHDLFAPRDCSNLGKKIITPPPPSVKKIFEQLQEAGED